MSFSIQASAHYWSTGLSFDLATRSEIAGLIASGATAELNERFYRDLEFGTGGLRGIMGAGSARMNVYNVRRATAALALHLQESFAQPELRVAIAYDSRRYSREFAMATAEVLAGYGIHAYITAELRPVPMLSFMVRHYQCHAGVCITASHNPPEYNGYKVYWQDGGQLVPPHDSQVIGHYQRLTRFEDIPCQPFTAAQAAGLVHEVSTELDEAYFKVIDGLSLFRGGRSLKIVYSPLHGSGAYPVTASLKRFGFTQVTVVPEQAVPDGNFPTVQSPNPEDPRAMALALALAEKIGADLVLATDPDADRLGIIIKHSGEFYALNGNQIGSVLVEYVLRLLHETGKMPASPLVIKTIVTTDLQEKIAQHYGASCEETLTGFKWIGQRIEEYESGKRQPYRHYVCGGEESFGFLRGQFVRDKDAVSSACLAAEMCAYFQEKGQSLLDVLDELYRRHGVYEESLETLTLPGMDGERVIKAMMARLRTEPPQSLAGVPVQALKDYAEGRSRTWLPGGKVEEEAITLPRSDVLQFVLKDGTKLSARPSGTEPKIKFYFSVYAPVSPGVSDHDLTETKQRCRQRIKQILAEFMQLAQAKGP